MLNSAVQHLSNCDNYDNDDDDDDDDAQGSTTISSSLAGAESNIPSDCMVCSLTFLSKFGSIRGDIFIYW